jgi:homoserine O-succinyltransferase
VDLVHARRGPGQVSVVDGDDAPTPPGALACALVNNMPDPAFAATEDQFVGLLRAASSPTAVVVRRYHLPSHPRSAEAGRTLLAGYVPVSELWSSGADLVIVTGSEPVTPGLADEPYWPELARTLDWARASGCGLLLSCLAAHAALWHWDGLARRRLEAKCSGVFSHRVHPCAPVVSGLAPTAPLPHSRLNDVPADGLRAQDHHILLEADVGWGIAWADWGGGCLLFQGHPEYGADTLLREYRRDVGRWHAGQLEAYPAPPASYFDEVDLGRLGPFAHPARRRDPQVMAKFPFAELARRRRSPWTAVGARVCANWLELVAARRVAG